MNLNLSTRLAGLEAIRQTDILDPVRVLYPDPPWNYADIKKFRRDNSNKLNKRGIGAAARYVGTMEPDEIAGLGEFILPVLARDAYCFPWVTASHFPNMIEILPEWGFEYKGIFKVWTKTNRDGNFRQNPGTYNWTNVELCLLATRGESPWHINEGWKPNQIVPGEEFLAWEDQDGNLYPVEGRDHSPIVWGPQWDEEKQRYLNKPIHSRKPPTVRNDISRWLDIYRPHKCELFATEFTPGWTCLGHSVTGRDIREDLAALAERIDHGRRLFVVPEGKRTGRIVKDGRDPAMVVRDWAKENRPEWVDIVPQVV